MKYLFSLLLMISINTNLPAQYTLEGKVIHICGSTIYEKPFVTVKMEGIDSTQHEQTDFLGEFIFKELSGNYKLKIRHIGSPDFEAQICVEENLDNIMIVLDDSCFDHVLIGKQKKVKFKRHQVLDNVLYSYGSNKIKKSSKRAKTNCN